MATRLSGVFYGATPRGMSSGLVRPVRWVVLHATDNTASARAEANYAATRTDDRSRWTSSHFYVDSQEIVGSVPLDMRAWAAYSEANTHGWHVEMCGISDRVPAAVIARTAGLVARLCKLDSVPVRHCTPSMVAALQRGITGHADITEGLNVGTHTDPGPHFNWSGFLSMVEGGFLMALTEAEQDELLAAVREIRMRAGFIDGRIEAIATGSDKMHDGFPTPGAVQWLPGAVKAIATAVGQVDEAVKQQLADEFAALDAAIANQDQVDAQAVAAAVLATLTPEAIAAAIPADLADQVADELAARLAS